MTLLRGRMGLCLILMGTAIASGPGCVRRTVTINTDPQGATVLLNDQHVGTSPATVDFTWYGDYDVVLRKDGYQTLKTSKRLKAPWHQLPGIDLFTEVLTPFTFHDNQEMSFALEPAQPIDRQTLLKDAVDFRERALFGGE